MFLMGCVTVGLLMTFVVPMFVHVFEESGQILPLPTRILVVISDFVSGWWWVIVPCGVGAGVGFVRFFQSASGRGFWSWLSLRMPILSPAFTKAEIALLANTLGALLGNGVSIIYALQTAGSIVRNTLFKRAVGEIALAVRDGAQLSRAVAAEALFPAMVADVIAVGETSGLLSESLLQLGEEYDHELERELKVLMTLLEPVMIIGVGAVVGFIVMAMILPVFQLGDTLQ
jgi:general secretion pathway protein F